MADATSSEFTSDALSFLDGLDFELSWFTILVGFVIAYWGYYYAMAVRKPQVYSHVESQLLPAVQKHCPILFENYWPTFWGYHAHITSIFRARFQSKLTVQYEREILTLRDGGEVALDWAKADKCNNPTILLILPGLTGSSTHNYIGYMVMDGIERNFHPVVFNQRGNGGVAMKTPRTYCAANTEDLREVISHIKKKHQNSSLMAAGVSIGGMLLIKYLHECGSSSNLVGVVTFSTLWDPVGSRQKLLSFPNKYIYNYFFARKLRNMLLRQESEFEGRSDVAFDIKSVRKVKTLEDFDKHVTIKVFKYSSIDEYYRDCVNKEKVSAIRTPLISINATDDPFVPACSLPVEEFQTNPLTVLVLTKRGGHFGFIEGLLPTGGTWMNRALRQCLHALQHHNN